MNAKGGFHATILRPGMFMQRASIMAPALQ